MSPRRRRSPKQTFGVLTIVLVVIVGFAAYTYASQYQLRPYLVWLATLSVVTFIWYGFDKGQSKRGGLRVPEAAGGHCSKESERDYSTRF